jgi:hypothetical protein
MLYGEPGNPYLDVAALFVTDQQIRVAPSTSPRRLAFRNKIAHGRAVARFIGLPSDWSATRGLTKPYAPLDCCRGLMQAGVMVRAPRPAGFIEPCVPIRSVGRRPSTVHKLGAGPLSIDRACAAAERMRPFAYIRAQGEA